MYTQLYWLMYAGPVNLDALFPNEEGFPLCVNHWLCICTGKTVLTLHLRLHISLFEHGKYIWNKYANADNCQKSVTCDQAMDFGGVHVCETQSTGYTSIIIMNNIHTNKKIDLPTFRN